MANDDRTTMTIQEILKSVNQLREDKRGANSISPALTQLKSPNLGILISEDRNSWRFADPMFKAYVREHRNELLLKKV